MPSTRRIPHLTTAVALVLALLAGSIAATAPARAAQQAAPATTVPVSQYNAPWPPEPAGGPLPAVVLPAAPPADPRYHTAVPVIAGLLILAACTAVATGVRLRPRLRRRVAA